MARARVDMHRLQELVRLHRMGVSVRESARRLKMGRDTHREYCKILAAAELLSGDGTMIPDLAVLRAAVKSVIETNPRLEQASSVETHGDAIREMLSIGARPKAIFDALVLRDPEFRGSLSAVKRLCAREAKRRGIRAEEVAIPVETAPGEVAQVDFGYVGMIRDNKSNELRRAWVFVMTLAFSRHMFAKIVFDQKLETWQQLHVDAFAYFGGSAGLNKAPSWLTFGTTSGPARGFRIRRLCTPSHRGQPPRPSGIRAA